MEIHATAMPRPEGVTPGLVALGEQAESQQRHSSLARAQDQLGRGQTEVEIHATAMPCPEGVTPGLVALGEQAESHQRHSSQTKGVRSCWYDFCGRSHSCKGLEYPRGRGSTYAQLPPLFVSSEG